MADVVKQVNQATMTRWGGLSGDMNPLHVDPDFAAGTRYGRTILHGHLTVTWLCEWALGKWGTAWATHGVIEGLRYRRPLFADHEYRVRGEVRGDGSAADVTIAGADGEVRVLATMRLREPWEVRP